MIRASATKRPDVELHVDLSAPRDVAGRRAGEGGVPDTCSSQTRLQLCRSGSEQFPSKFHQRGNYFSKEVLSADGVT